MSHERRKVTCAFEGDMIMRESFCRFYGKFLLGCLHFLWIRYNSTNIFKYDI